MLRELTVSSRGRGREEITPAVSEVVREAAIEEGLCTVMGATRPRAS